MSENIITSGDLQDAARKGDISFLKKAINIVQTYPYLSDKLRKIWLSFIIREYAKYEFNKKLIRNNVIEYIIKIDNIEKPIFLGEIAKKAAKTNNNKIILLLFNSGFKFDETIGYIAAKYNSIDVLMSLYDSCDFKFNEVTFIYASENGHLDCVKYLHKINCPIDVYKCNVDNAAIINWGIDNNIIFHRERSDSNFSRRNSFSDDPDTIIGKFVVNIEGLNLNSG